MNILFINDSTSSSNWGDRAAAFSLKEMVAEAGAKIMRSLLDAGDALSGRVVVWIDQATLRHAD